MGIRPEDGTMLVSSVLFSECEYYTKQLPSLRNGDQSLQEILYYEACRQNWKAVLLTSKLVLQPLKILWHSRTLKGRMAQMLADCNSARKCHARDKFFQSFRYDYLVPQQSRKSEERFVWKEVQIEIAHRKLLKMNGVNGVLKFFMVEKMRGLVLYIICRNHAKFGSRLRSAANGEHVDSSVQESSGQRRGW